MPHPILILGGYGNFGKRIAQRLINHGLGVVIAGRNIAKAQALCTELCRYTNNAKTFAFDVETGLDHALTQLRPKVVINTCGPFQSADYKIAETCIQHGVHYIDLADGRDFVTGITTLDAQAKAQNVTVISGASTVPGLSSAVLAHYAQDFSQIDRLRFGISPGQKAERGLATTQGILSYVGRPLKPAYGQTKQRYGWQDIYRQTYPGLGKRWMATCDIPDLDLLPQAFPIRDIQFSAGLELTPLHLGLWALSWLVRLGLPLKLERWARPLLAISNVFNRFGTADGGMHIIMDGHDQSEQAIRREWFIIIKDGYGPYIPIIPAVLLAKQLVSNEKLRSGARPCVGLIPLEDYLVELSDFAPQVTTSSLQL